MTDPQKNPIYYLPIRYEPILGNRVMCGVCRKGRHLRTDFDGNVHMSMYDAKTSQSNSSEGNALQNTEDTPLHTYSISVDSLKKSDENPWEPLPQNASNDNSQNSDQDGDITVSVKYIDFGSVFPTQGTYKNLHSNLFCLEGAPHEVVTTERKTPTPTSDAPTPTSDAPTPTSDAQQAPTSDAPTPTSDAPTPTPTPTNDAPTPTPTPTNDAPTPTPTPFDLKTLNWKSGTDEIDIELVAYFDMASTGTQVVYIRMMIYSFIWSCRHGCGRTSIHTTKC